jgi:hypothetical protein
VGIWIKFNHIKALTSHEPNQYCSWFMSVCLSVMQPYCQQWLEHTTLLLQKVLTFLQVNNYIAFKTARLLQKPPVNQPIKHNVSKRPKLIFDLIWNKLDYVSHIVYFGNIMLKPQKLTCCSLDIPVRIWVGASEFWRHILYTPPPHTHTHIHTNTYA